MVANRPLDVLFVHPGSKSIYQGLRGKYSAIETPTWSLLLAQACRSKGFGVAILDCDADGLTDEQAVTKVKEANPRLVCFVVYGSEPNQGSVKMADAVPLATLLKQTHPQYKIAFTGSHTQALPLEVLALPCVDYVLPNEGVLALQSLLRLDLKRADVVDTVRGVGWKDDGKPVLNDPEQIVPQDRMDKELPGYAWDLIDLKKYRSHFWFSSYNHQKQSPYAALYTSIGCPFKCSFCCINEVNRSSNDPNYTAADSNIFRYWSPWHTYQQINRLAELGVKNIRISDEMFFLRRGHYEPLLELIKARYGDSLNLWAYARVDTVKPSLLQLFRSAGVRWLCLGIESGNTAVRREVAKGSYEEVNIYQVVKEVEDADIDVIANYIFGLPNDTLETMEETYKLSVRLLTRMWNAYPAMALPGSPLYQQAKAEGLQLPDSYSGYGFLSYECTPLGTSSLTPADVLRFRDEAFHRYWSRPDFQAKVEAKFGSAASENIREMLQVKLKRKLLGHQAGE